MYELWFKVKDYDTERHVICMCPTVHVAQVLWDALNEREKSHGDVRMVQRRP